MHYHNIGLTRDSTYDQEWIKTMTYSPSCGQLYPLLLWPKLKTTLLLDEALTCCYGYTGLVYAMCQNVTSTSPMILCYGHTTMYGENVLYNFSYTYSTKLASYHH